MNIWEFVKHTRLSSKICFVLWLLLSFRNSGAALDRLFTSLWLFGNIFGSAIFITEYKHNPVWEHRFPYEKPEGPTRLWAIVLLCAGCFMSSALPLALLGFFASDMQAALGGIGAFAMLIMGLAGLFCVIRGNEMMLGLPTRKQRKRMLQEEE